MKKTICVTFSLFLLLGLLNNIELSFAEAEYMPFESLPNVKDADEYTPYYKDEQLRGGFTFPSELPQVPAELMVYKEVPAEELTYENMKVVGDLFGMGDNCVVYPGENGGYTTYGDRGVKSIHFNGSLKNFEFDDIAVKPIEGKSLPDEETGKSIAEAYLREKGLWLEELELAGFSYMRTGSIGRTEMTIEYKIYQVNNNPVKGKVKVTIIPGPKIKEVKYLVNYFQAYKLVKTITPQQAIERINQGNAYFFTKDAGFSSVIMKCTLNYQVAGGEINPEVYYLQPLYYFEGNKSIIKVSAVSDYYLKKEKEIFATVDIKPDTIELKSQGKWITCYLELPEGYNVADIILSSISVNAGRERVAWDASPVATGDYDHDGVPDLMMKFNREAIQNVLKVGERVPLLVVGTVKDKPFRAIDYIRVIE